jgi:hypothetical protein
MRWTDGLNAATEAQVAADAEFIAHARQDIPWLLAQHATLIARTDDLVLAKSAWERKSQEYRDRAEAAESALDEATKTAQQWCDQFSAEAVKANGLRVALDEARKARDEKAEAELEPFELDRHAKEPARLLRQLAQVVGARDLFYPEPDDGGWTQAFTATERRRIARTLNEFAALVYPSPVPLDPPAQGDHE